VTWDVRQTVPDALQIILDTLQIPFDGFKIGQRTL